MDVWWITQTPIAHRGLHNGSSAIENSVSAFREAIRCGYAIECDIQNTKTEPVVFHDPKLDRLVGLEQRVIDMTHEELGGLALQNGDPICSLKALLELVDTKVPLIVEVKVEGKNEEYVAKIAESVKGYDGLLALMSFDADIVREIGEVMPEVARGLVAIGDDTQYETHNINVGKCEPHFLSYNVDNLPNKFVSEIKKKMPVITWTVKTEEQIVRTQQYAHQMTFEGFLPKLESLCPK